MCAPIQRRRIRRYSPAVVFALRVVAVRCGRSPVLTWVANRRIRPNVALEWVTGRSAAAFPVTPVPGTPGPPTPTVEVTALTTPRGARDRHDGAVIAEARGYITASIGEDASASAVKARTALAAVIPDPTWPPDDLRAHRVMAGWIARAPQDDAHHRCYDANESWTVTADRGFAALADRIEDEYARAQGAVDIGEVSVTRLGVLDRLGVEPNPDPRRRPFYAPAPRWQTIDAD